MLFDTHAHYDDEAFDADRDALLTALPQRGVGLILNPGCDVESSRKAVTYAAAYPHVYAAVGIHPENCGGCTADDLAAVRALAQQPKVVAIGEIGLDYYWEENPPRDFQQQVLRQQLALARELAGTPAAETFRADLPHRYFEENQLHAFLIERIRHFGETVAALEAFLPYVDNWATCDQMRPPALGQDGAALAIRCRAWLASGSGW